MQEDVKKKVTRLISIHENLITFLQKHLNDKQFLIISGVLVGLSSALAAILLKWMVFQIHGLILPQRGSVSPFIYAFCPMIGILITSIIINKSFKGKLGGGNGEIIYAVKKRESRLPRQFMYSHIITSAVTVGMGGSTGLETPIVTTGAAIGSNYGKTYKVSAGERTILLACGVAAGIGATFNAPIAGVLFAVEVFVSEISVASFIPILIAAAAGAIISKIILNEDILLSFHLQQPFNYVNVPFYILLGLLAGVISVYYIRVFSGIEKLLKRVKQKYAIHKAIAGGLFLGILILLFPQLFGEGYASIKYLSDQTPYEGFRGSLLENFISSPLILMVFLTAIVFIKAVATGITLGSGGNGGNFAPSLFVGAFLGFIYASLMNYTGLFHLPVSNFTIVAMGGILSGIFHAPLTGIFLIAEITGGYDLIVPLMIVSALSFAVSKYLHEDSLDRMMLRGRL